MTISTTDTRIADVEIIPINAYYVHQERSAIVSRAGITETLVKISLENGLVGWGEDPLRRLRWNFIGAECYAAHPDWA